MQPPCEVPLRTYQVVLKDEDVFADLTPIWSRKTRFIPPSSSRWIGATGTLALTNFLYSASVSILFLPRKTSDFCVDHEGGTFAGWIKRERC
jgi:hypothetical protein